MRWESENETLLPDESRADRPQGYTITRAKDAKPHVPNWQRAAQLHLDFVLPSAVQRGLALFRETADCGGAAAVTLFSMAPNCWRKATAC